MQGQGEAEMAQVLQGIAAWRATGAALLVPYFSALLAEVCDHLGRPEDGLQALAEVHTLTWDPLTPPLSRRERVKRVRVQANSDYAPVSLACKAWRTFSEVTGRSVILTPTASSTALTIAGATAPIGCSPMDLPP
jgi:hypothetical protein